MATTSRAPASQDAADKAPVASTGPATVAVWDLALRLFHWLLVAGMGYALFAEAGTALHEVVGYGLIQLVAFRILWGFMGPPHARFSAFVHGPRVVVAYLVAILRGRPSRHLGHNPAGGIMVVALLAAVLATAGSGYAMTTDALWGEAWIEELHAMLANASLALIVLHVAGVVLASIQHRENLVKAMVTGRKAAD